MADEGLRAADEPSEQAEQSVKQKAKWGAQKVGKYVGKGVKKVGQKVGKKVGKAVGNGAKKLGKKAAQAVGKAVKAGIKALVQIAKMFLQILIKLLALIGWPLLIVIIIILVFSTLWVFNFEERGARQSNDLMPGTENPVVRDAETAVTTAVAMTEPQAVIDAYYKYMSTQSFTKEYNGKLYEFADEQETQDFSALRDYYDKENNFYLSDDFIRLVDETLHQDEFYYPEQVIKPVYGKQLNLTDKNGETVSAYTALLPTDYATGENSLMFEDNIDDPDDVLVTGFGDMVTDRSQLDNTDIEGANDEVPSLVAMSQTPREFTSTDPEEEGLVFYALEERNVINNTGATGNTPGLWDYGFGSVLQYEPHQKIQYITCTYTDVDVDIHSRSRHWIEGDEDEEGEWSDWSEWGHDTVHSMSLDGLETRAQLEANIDAYLDSINPSTDTYEVEYSYDLPTNINAILSDDTNWSTSSEPNASGESALGRAYSNSHIDMKVEGAKDIDISRLEFSGDLEAFANHGSALYPLNIALITHAATFSGNINYTITPAGEDGCNESRTSLQANTIASIDHREPVKTIVVAGGCGEVELTATRDGEVVTQTPKVEETDSPWGFSYLQQYANNYRAYVPSDFTDDRDFFLRAGLKAVQNQLNGVATWEDDQDAEQYATNLEFLMDLGLLRLYSGGTQSAMGTVNIADMEDSQSDLYILSHLIAAEAANDKLDQLLVGAVFVNRVLGENSFPDTYWGVLTQEGQYACMTDGHYDGPSWQPTDEEIASAIQCMTGQFALPSNVVFQTQDPNEGEPFMKNGVHYYALTNGQTVPSAYDVWGRKALTPSELQAHAKTLENVDPNDISGEAINFDASTAVFIGDSLTESLNANAGLGRDGATVIAQQGAGLDAIRRLVENSSASDWTGKDRVYVLAGTNSSTMQPNDFRDAYNDLLDAIRAKAPTGITITLTSMPPVNDSGSHNTSNSWVNRNNEVIEDIATKNGFQLLDIWSILQENGSLNPDYDVGDGLHLNTAGYRAWYSMIRGGVTSSSIGSEAESGLTGSTTVQGVYDIMSAYTLYEIEGFDVLSAINMQAALTNEDETTRGFLSALWHGAGDIIGTGIDFFASFFRAMDELIFPTTRGRDKCITGATLYNLGDVEAIVYSTITFTSQVWFSTAEDAADEQLRNGNITFVFVGKDAILGLGTSGVGATAQLVPGVSTTIEGLISPTDAYYSPLTPFNGVYMEINMAPGTEILVVGDGEIVDVGTSESASSSMGKYVVQQITLPDGRLMEVTYGFLDTIDVSAPTTVEAGWKIGTSGTNTDGKGSLYFSVSIDGSFVDPMSIFYQSTLVYGAGSLGKNLNNPDGTANTAALQELHDELNVLVGGLEPNTYYPEGWYNKETMPQSPYFTGAWNPLQGLQCTWWAYGRGLQYVQTFYPGRVSSAQYESSMRHNGNGVYGLAQSKGIFATGTTPKPNSLVSFESDSSPQYGHVAYVEAVDYVNRVYYVSEAGGGDWWGGLRLTPVPFTDPGVYAYGGYRLIGFVYLDEILI